MGLQKTRFLPQGDRSPLGAALHPDGWISVQIVPDNWLGTLGWQVPGGRHETRGNLAETGSCSTPSWPGTPEGVPAAQLVPQWHVTNGDMFLLPCFVRLVSLIENKTAGTSQFHMSAEKGADSSKAPANTQTNEK